MKKLLLLILLFIGTHSNINAFWVNRFYVDDIGGEIKHVSGTVKENKNVIIIHDYFTHPAQFTIKITLESKLQETTSDKDGTIFYDYKGTFEYYTKEDKPDIRSILISEHFVDPTAYDPSKCFKKKNNVKIRIAFRPIKEKRSTRYKKYYCVFFEEKGLTYIIWDDEE